MLIVFQTMIQAICVLLSQSKWISCNFFGNEKFNCKIMETLLGGFPLKKQKTKYEH